MRSRLFVWRMSAVAVGIAAAAILPDQAAMAGIAPPSQLTTAGDGFVSLIRLVCFFGSIAGVIWMFFSMKYGGGEGMVIKGTLTLAGLAGMAWAPTIVEAFGLRTTAGGGLVSAYVGMVAG